MPPNPTHNPRIVVVMCTHNGEEWVQEQLESLLAQTSPVAIRVFDDASTDSTVAKVLKTGEEHDVKCTERAEALGFVQNFAHGIQSVLDEGFEYIALADQDDIWLTDRIELGMKTIQAAESAQGNQPGPHLVHSDLILVNAHNVVLHPSFMQWRDYRIDKTRSLATVLGQNGVMGNTVLMNASLARLALPFPADLHAHDYWLALVAELLGQRHYLSQGMVRYRIHDKNVSNSSHNVSLGVEKWSNSWSLARILAFNLRLPFKEDTRFNTVSTLINDSRFKMITKQEREIIGAFHQYLNFSESRIKLLVLTFRYGFFRPSLRHRLRIVVSLLTTRRYNKPH